MNKSIIATCICVVVIAGGVFVYSKNTSTKFSPQISDESLTTEIVSTTSLDKGGTVVVETKSDLAAFASSTESSEASVVSETKAIIKSFTVKQNQDEKNLPIIFADLSWEVVGADSVSLDFVSCPKGVKIFFVHDNLFDVCGNNVVFFDDNHQGTTTLLVKDTGLSSTTGSKDLRIDIALRAQNNINNQLFTTGSQNEIHLSERQMGDIKAYPNMSDIDGAEAALREYFNLVKMSDFNKALLYISPENASFSSYATAFDYTNKNPFVGIIDFFSDYLCELNYACDVTISKVIHRKKVSDGVFEFTVSFIDKNGELFGTPPVCYEGCDNAKSRTEYVYRVSKIGSGIFNIVEPITGPSEGQ